MSIARYQIWHMEYLIQSKDFDVSVLIGSGFAAE